MSVHSQHWSVCLPQVAKQCQWTVVCSIQVTLQYTAFSSSTQALRHAGVFRALMQMKIGDYYGAQG